MYLVLLLWGPFCTRAPITWLLERISLVQENYQGEKIPTACGLYLFLHLLPILPLMPGDLFPQIFFLTLVTGGGFLDDLYGQGEHGGLWGHLRFFSREKRFNTALLKVLFSGMGAFYLLLPFSFYFFLDLLLLLLATNSMNLLDLRPGRAMKGFLLFTLPLFLLNLIPWVLLFFSLPFFLYLSLELQEQGMLGDTGANLLGALLGMVILPLTFPLRLLMLFLFFFLHTAAEISSLSLLIEGNLFFKRLDALWRRSH